MLVEDFSIDVDHSGMGRSISSKCSGIYKDMQGCDGDDDGDRDGDMDWDDDGHRDMDWDGMGWVELGAGVCYHDG